MIKHAWTVILVCFLSGCHSRALVLDAKWHPLKEVRELSLPFASNSSIVTLGEHAYTHDLQDWQRSHPEGPRRDATLLHEQAHSRRQDSLWWFIRYAFDAEFAWEEEKLGWAIQLQHLKAHGIAQQPEYYARILARYFNIMGEITTYEDALAFAKEVLK